MLIYGIKVPTYVSRNTFPHGMSEKDINYNGILTIIRKIGLMEELKTDAMNNQGSMQTESVIKEIPYFVEEYYGGGKYNRDGLAAMMEECINRKDIVSVPYKEWYSVIGLPLKFPWEYKEEYSKESVTDLLLEYAGMVLNTKPEVRIYKTED